jgi:WD40 repeat protein
VTLLFVLPAGPRLAAQELKEIGSFAGNVRSAEGAAFRRDGKVLAVNFDGGLKLWDVAAGKEIAFSSDPVRWHAIDFSPDGKVLALGQTDNLVSLWDVATGRNVLTLRGHREAIHAVRFSPDGKTLVSATGVETRRWDIATSKEIASFKRPVRVWVTSIAFSKDTKTLAAANHQEIDLWDLDSGKERAILSEHRGRVYCVTFSVDEKALVTASTYREGKDTRSRGEIKLWDLGTNRERMTLQGQFGLLYAMALSPDGKYLAVLDYSDLRNREVVLKLLEVSTSRVCFSHKGTRQSLLTLTYTPEGRLLVVGSGEANTVKVWEVASPPP